MAVKSLAIKYRPKDWSDVTEQGSVKTILQNQLGTNEIKHAYLFCGGAGTGKTTCARIFANEINNGQGTPIEVDAATHNSVDDARVIIEDSKTQSIDSEYKVFILDECHMMTNQAWNAMLKVIEEPPSKTIFIFCTTNPEKIPQTILSRVQRYDFHKISTAGISKRLHDICVMEELAPVPDNGYTDAIDYIAKIANGGMRTAISLMDKCLSYSPSLTVENVVKALGVANYDDYIDLMTAMVKHETSRAIEVVEQVASSGKDFKQFISGVLEFCLDVCKYITFRDCDPFKYIKIPSTDSYARVLSDWVGMANVFKRYVDVFVNLSASIKYESNPLILTEAMIYRECAE